MSVTDEKTGSIKVQETYMSFGINNITKKLSCVLSHLFLRLMAIFRSWGTFIDDLLSPYKVDENFMEVLVYHSDQIFTDAGTA